MVKRLLAVWIINLLVVTSAFAHFQYKVQAVNGIGSGWVQDGRPLYSMNNFGVVAATVYNSDDVAHVFVWKNGVATDYGEGTARAINDLGQVVGHATDGSSRLWSADGTPQHINGFGTIASINNLGQIAGLSSTSFTGITANLSNPDALQVIGSGYIGIAINDAGLIAGYTLGPYSTLQAGIWQDGTLTYITGDTQSRAFYVNSAGQVLGTLSHDVGFLWTNGTLEKYDLYPFGINDSGQIIGLDENNYSYLLRQPDGTACYARDFLTPGYDCSLGALVCINNAGQILARGTLDGQYQFLLLTPIPEPACVLLLGLGAVWIRRKAENWYFR